MEIEEIISSGFFKQFISDYYEDKIYTYYTDKDRLLYILCDTEVEKDKVTLAQIEKIKKKIKSLGNEELSFSFIISGRSESHEFINDYNERYEFWLDRFHETFVDNLSTLQPIYDNFELFQKTKFYKEYGLEKFWDMYPEAEKPKVTRISDVLLSENDLVSEIEYIVGEYKKEKDWDFDFNIFSKYVKTSKPVKDLFNICELFVQLNRLEMFKGFIEPIPILDHQNDAKSDTSENDTSENDAKYEMLENELKKHEFFNLQMLIPLSDLNKKEIVNTLFTNDLPYKISYLEYLGFVNYIDNNYTEYKKDTHKLIAKILGVNERAVRGNINGLRNAKSVDRVRYTAYLHTEKIKEHYAILKLGKQEFE